MIEVITAVTAGRDRLKPAAQETGDRRQSGRPNASADLRETVRYICFADRPKDHSCEGWEVRELEPVLWKVDQARRASRSPKILSHRYSQAEYTIWMDACAEPLVDPREFAAEALRDADIAVIRHERLDHRTEQAFCREKRVGDTAAIARQIEIYEQDGFSGAPFVCGGLIVRRENATVRAFNERWWWEYAAGQERDQFALAYALWKSGVKVRVLTPGVDFPGVSIWDNPWFRWHPHAGRCPSGTGRRQNAGGQCLKRDLYP